MSITLRSLAYPYGMGVLSVAVALLLMLALNPLAMMTQSPFLLFTGAVVISARHGGIKAGLVATGLSALISNYFFLEPVGALALGLSDLVRTVVFIAQCTLISAICGALRQSNQRLDRSLFKLRASEESLRIANQHISEILESITDGFYTLDQQWQFTYVNSQAEQILKRSRDELLGQNILELFSNARGTIFEESFQRVVTKRVPVVFESRGVVNSERWFEVHITPLNDGLAVYFHEVTERKRAEEALRQSEERFRIVLENFPDVVSLYDADLRLQFVNTKGLQMSGKTLAELVGRRSTELWPKEITDLYLPIMLRAVETRSPQTQEVAIPLPEGGFINFNVTYIPLLDAEEKIAQIISVFQDISERKRAEEALRLSENRYRTLANAVPQKMWINAPDGTTQFLNQQWCDYTGIPEGLNLKLWHQAIHPEDRQFVLETRNRAIQAGNAYEMELRLKRFDEIYHWHLVRVLPFKDEQGQILNWFGTATDIEDFKQTEAALRNSEAIAKARAEELETFMETVPAAVWIAHDPQCHQVTANRTAYKLLELPPGAVTTATPANGEYPFSFKIQQNGQSLPLQDLPMQKAGRTGQEIEAEIEFVFARGEVRSLIGRAVPLRNDTGEVRGVIGAFLDISERIQAEKERERLLAREQAAREEAEKANRIKDEFLAVLSHELRSPLNPILGWTKLLQTRKFDEATIERALATIERNAKLQTELIEDLLDVSRILRGKMVLNVAPVDLVSTIEAALETVRLAAESKSILIQTSFDNNIGLISGDSARLQQIVWNLVSNAVKFTPAGGRVEVRLERNDDRALIIVSDTGQGINPEFLPFVFDYFRQEDGKITRKFGGLGLGLAIARHLTELHGGTIKAESLGEDQGATFTVQLPLMSAIPEIAVDNSELLVNSFDLSQLRILVVDDEADMRDLTQTILQQHGAIVQVAGSAASALLTLEQFQPDVLISDIGMPQMDGYMLMQQVKAQFNYQGETIPTVSDTMPKAIALTAYAGEYDRQLALSAGFQLHLSKPVEPEALVKAVSQLCNNSETTFS